MKHWTNCWNSHFRPRYSSLSAGVCDVSIRKWNNLTDWRAGYLNRRAFWILMSINASDEWTRPIRTGDGWCWLKWRYLGPLDGATWDLQLPMTRPPIRRKHSSKRPIKTRLVRRPTAVINQSLWPIQLTPISGATASEHKKKSIQMIGLREAS